MKKSVSLMPGSIIYVATFFCSIYKVERIVASSNRCKGTEIIKKKDPKVLPVPHHRVDDLSCQYVLDLLQQPCVLLFDGEG